ncbi:HAD family phosphatase [Hymenobacter sp. NST-14]|uniref:HAD family hydrolase n=1 Tax=Hymenobacter piscis TaxID=2839984 RepID=UPI001C00EFD0|nr:HAD hydrolase-like protein [Hymenobacter piscis]MBT9394828.1 HAD family phosphatase [Hymenobacter piscis]
MGALAVQKDQRYQDAFRPHLQLLPGLANFLPRGHQRGVPMGIGSAAIPFNIDFVLNNLNLRPYFPVVISADDVTRSKPHPETFLKAAAQLGIPASDCLIRGRAQGRGSRPQRGYVGRGAHHPHIALEFADLPNVLHCAPDFTAPFMTTLLPAAF